MSHIGRKTIGNIETGRGQTDQGPARRQSWLRQAITPYEFITQRRWKLETGIQTFETESPVADCAADAYDVSAPRAAS